jgi:glycosyltransferase involved in cell wall biosynthesis
MTARGSDVTLYTGYAIPRALIRWASRACTRVITVSAALKRGLCDIGVDDHKVVVLRNGADLERFRPMDRRAAKKTLGIAGPLLLSVGNLVELKGHHLVVEAMSELRNVQLIILGEGPEKPGLLRLLRERGLEGRVRLAGNLPQDELVTYYNAADALVLASSREGMPNVVLECLACGTPVIATAVGGIPELLGSPAAGYLIHERSAAAIVDAYRKLAAHPWDHAATRAHAEHFGWAETVKGLLAVFRQTETG